jgi:hypothetical protein
VTLADHLLGQPHGPEFVMHADLSPLPKIVVDNVAEYYYHHDKEFWALSDFPDARPPLRYSWVEYRMPKTVRSREMGEKSLATDDPGVRVYFGACCFIADWDSPGDWHELLHPPKKADSFVLTGKYYYVWRDGSVDKASNSLSVKYKIPDEGEPFRDVKVDLRWRGSKNDDQVATELYVFHPILMAFSFANCKNVEKVTVYPPPKLNKARVRRSKQPLVTYSIINILPVSHRAPRNRSVESEDGAGVALHIRRGHFACYGEKYGKGKLFGKLEGRYWIPQTAVGDEALGERKHDYEVRAR